MIARAATGSPTSPDRPGEEATLESWKSLGRITGGLLLLFMSGAITIAIALTAPPVFRRAGERLAIPPAPVVPAVAARPGVRMPCDQRGTGAHSPGNV